MPSFARASAASSASESTIPVEIIVASPPSVSVIAFPISKGELSLYTVGTGGAEMRRATGPACPAMALVIFFVETGSDGDTSTRLGMARMAAISSDHDYNRYRLEAEMTLFADRADVTEECVRLRSHCEQFEQFIEAPEPSGRKLKFLLEEMHREVNTIGSKAQNLEISREVIFMKEEVEKIREQVLNIE